MMEKKRILRYLLFAKTNNKVLKIKTSRQKEMSIKVISYDNEFVQYKLTNNEKLSKIRYANIVSINFEKEEDEKEFVYKILSAKYGTIKLKEIIENFERYYLEIIEVLLSKEKKDSIGYINLNTKKRIYPQIFKKLPEDEDNLLFYYFTKKRQEEKENGDKKEESITEEDNKAILLIEQANLSQKKALDNALNERISIIEGPPGTGKTTTILNILANLIYENKKVLVVSKNNSAIENVAEELAQMDIPKCYIRMRKF